MDAKLARSAKARAVLQTAFYSHLLADLQGIAPRWMHLALGNGEFASFKVDDFAAYERQTRRLLEGPSAGTRRPSRTRSRSSTVPSAGGAICAASAGGPMMTCRWWPG